MLVIQSDPFFRFLEAVSDCVNLLSKTFLTFSSDLQLFIHGRLLQSVKRCCFDLSFDLHRARPDDAALESFCQSVFDDLSEAAKFTPDRVGLIYQSSQHSVLRPLRVNKIVTVHGLRRLELAINAAVALFESARIPWDIEVKEVVTMRLKIQSLTCSVRCQKDAQ